MLPEAKDDEFASLLYSPDVAEMVITGKSPRVDYSRISGLRFGDMLLVRQEGGIDLGEGA